MGVQIDVIFIHGIGPFSGRRVKAQVDRLASALRVTDIRTWFFNWDVIAGNPFSNLPKLAIAFRSMIQASLWPKQIGNRKLLGLSLLIAELICLGVALTIGLQAMQNHSIHYSLRLSLSDISVFSSVVCLVGVLWMSKRLRMLITKAMLLMLWPIIFMFGVFPYARLHYSLLALGFACLPLTLLSEPLAALLGVNTADVGRHILHFSAVNFEGVAAILLLTILSYPLLKLLADIFLWIGLPFYRDTLRSQLGRVFKDIASEGSRSSRLIIVGHSLGSLVAIDYLLHESSMPTQLSGIPIALITCGSPLRRLVQSFFPDCCLGLDDIRRYFSHRPGQLSWLNVYRPLDYIGGALGFPSSGTQFRDVRSCQRFKFHVDYWGDKKIWDVAIDFMRSIDDVSEVAIGLQRERPDEALITRPPALLAFPKRLETIDWMASGFEPLLRACLLCGVLAGGLIVGPTKAIPVLMSTKLSLLQACVASIAVYLFSAFVLFYCSICLFVITEAMTRIVAAYIGIEMSAPISFGHSGLFWSNQRGVIGRALNLDFTMKQELTADEVKQTINAAVADGDTEMVKTLIRRGIGVTQFSLATVLGRGQLDVARVLLERGADPNGYAKGSHTLLTLAIVRGQFRAASLLLEMRANPNYSKFIWCPLHFLAWARTPNRHSICLDPDSLPNLCRGNVQMKALNLPYDLDDDGLELARYLVNCGANPDMRVDARGGNYAGASPFFIAAAGADSKLMRVLSELGADARSDLTNGITPLMAAAGLDMVFDRTTRARNCAIATERLEAVSVALELGNGLNAHAQFQGFPPTDLPDCSGKTPPTAEEIIPGVTPLIAAVTGGVATVVEYLLNAGASLTTRNQRGWSALMVAQSLAAAYPTKESMRIVEILETART